MWPSHVNRPDELQESDVGTWAGIFEVKKIGDEFFAFIVECRDPKACTVLLRGASKDLLIETERNLQDAMSVARNVIKNPKLAPGGGPTELTVSATLKQESQSIEGIEKWPSLQIWDAYNVKVLTFKTAIETTSMLLRNDDIVSRIKKKQAPRAGKTPSKPTIEQEGDADNEQMIPSENIRLTKPARILSCIQRADPLVQMNSSFQPCSISISGNSFMKSLLFHISDFVSFLF